VHNVTDHLQHGLTVNGGGPPELFSPGESESFPFQVVLKRFPVRVIPGAKKDANRTPVLPSK
jgi:hypothetical protein